MLLGKNVTQRLAGCRVATYLQSVKIKVFAKCNSHNRIKHVPLFIAQMTVYVYPKGILR